MEETLTSQKMKEIDFLNNLEKISSLIPNRILKIEGYILNKNQKEHLEIIIFKVFISYISPPIEINLKIKGIEFRYILTNFKLYEAPLMTSKDNFIRENQNSVFFLNKKNWI